MGRGRGRGRGNLELGIGSWGLGVASGEWVNGEWSWGSLAKRTKSERGKKELGIELVVRGRVLNHKDAMTQKGHKEKSVKIYQIGEHIFLNTNGEWSLAKRTKSERGKKVIWDWVSAEGEGF